LLCQCTTHHMWICPRHTHTMIYFFAWFQASATTYMRSALFWVITQWVVVISCRHFGTIIGPILKGRELSDSWPLKMGPIVCPEMSIRNYHYLLHNYSEECSFHIFPWSSVPLWWQLWPWLVVTILQYVICLFCRVTVVVHLCFWLMVCTI